MVFDSLRLELSSKSTSTRHARYLITFSKRNLFICLFQPVDDLNFFLFFVHQSNKCNEGISNNNSSTWFIYFSTSTIHCLLIFIDFLFLVIFFFFFLQSLRTPRRYWFLKCTCCWIIVRRPMRAQKKSTNSLKFLWRRSTTRSDSANLKTEKLSPLFEGKNYISIC